MKIRTGFVSNSSSSSFVVAIDHDPAATKVSVTTEIDLKDFASKIASNITELKEWFSYNYGYNPDDGVDDQYLKEEYDKCLDAINRGKTIIFGRFSDEDRSGVETMLCYEGLHGKVDEDKVEIIHSEGGY